MIVAASTECFPELSLADAMGKLVDLEYTNVEIDIHENGNHMKPSQVAANLDGSIDACLETQRMNLVALSLQFNSQGQRYFHEFNECCKLAKATKVVTVTIPSSELGTPFNEEVETLRKLVAIAESNGVRIAIKSQIGRLSEDPDTVMVLCDNVPGLGLTLDPSHYISGPHAGRDYGKLLKYVFHVHLRDSTKEKLQVQIGQGVVEYGKLINQLRKSGYDRALSTHMLPLDDIDFRAEMRKMRLLLESLVI